MAYEDILQIHQARCHPLNSIPNSWVLRDDELSFGISGTKLRKFASLIPWIKKRGFKKAAIIGGAHSNNIVGLAQVCNEHNISTKPFLLGPPNNWEGNAALVKLIWKESDIQWISREQWPQAEKIVKAWCDHQQDALLIPEGCFMPQVIPGALTQAHDIQNYCRMVGRTFDNIFIDAGTGLTAQILINAQRRGYLHKDSRIKVVSMAIGEDDFEQGVVRVSDFFSEMGLKKSSTDTKYDFYRPKIGKSFGSFPASILNEIRLTAQQEGILLDPIYSGKLFHTARALVQEKQRNLLIHSGGAYALSGFSHRWL